MVTYVTSDDSLWATGWFHTRNHFLNFSAHFLNFSFKQIHFHPQKAWMPLSAVPPQRVPPKERPCCHQQLDLGPAAAPSTAPLPGLLSTGTGNASVMGTSENSLQN